MITAEIKSQIESLNQQLVEKFHPEKVILFGSAARESDTINDIDLFIVKEDVPNLGAERIRHLYRTIDTDLPVDYLVYRPSEVTERLAMGDPFIISIFREGKVLYG